MSTRVRLPFDRRALSVRAGVYHNPLAQADAAITSATVLDSGQTVKRAHGGTPPKYLNGGITVDPAGASGAATAGYLTLATADGNPVAHMAEQIGAPAGAIGGIAFVVPSAAWNHDNVGGALLPAAGVHLTNYPNGVWNCAVWNPASGQSGHVDFSVQPGAATSFTLTLTTTTPAATATTSSLTTKTATAASVQAALVALNAAYASKITVTKSASGNYGVTLDTTLGASGGATTATLTITGSGGTVGMAAPTPANSANTIPGVVSYGSGLTQYGDYTTFGRYATISDGALHWQELFIDQDRDRVRYIYPDGTSSTWMYHPGIGLWANYAEATFEWFNNNISSVDTPSFGGRLYVDSAKTHSDTIALTKPTVLDLLASAASQVLVDQGNTTNADITITGTVPAGARFFDLALISGSGGAGSGSCGSGAQGGGGAGGTAGWIEKVVPIPATASSWSLVIGKKGLGGASVSTAGSGNAGTGSTATKFSISNASSKVLAAYQAFGAGGGTAGQAGGAAAAGGGSGGPNVVGAGAASVIGGAAGGTGGGNTTGLGTSGSGAGGGITSGGVASNGGAGGSNLPRGYTGGTAGVVAGASPGVGTDITATAITTVLDGGIPGPGVGGGAASITGAAQAGATPIQPGPGGGGGGASTTGNASGKGGDGAGGWGRLGVHF